jgi:hypothetical protein
MMGANPFAEHYRPASTGAAQIHEDTVQVRFSQDLKADLKRQQKEGWRSIGTSEFVERNRMGVSHDARLHAASIGASLVLFTTIPAKLRSIKRRKNGAIDLASVLADPPASPSSRGHYVVQAAFLVRVS